MTALLAPLSSRWLLLMACGWTLVGPVAGHHAHHALLFTRGRL